MIKEIVELGNPLLREKASPLANTSGADVQHLIKDLLDTMEAAKGVGIAAPQIGISQRVFIVASKPNERYPHAPLMRPTPMVNPELEWASSDTNIDWEGCLSIPGLRALVPRSSHIRVRYIDPEQGKTVVAEFRDFVARVWQHEYDHLDGIVFPDRIRSSKDLVTDKEFRRIIAERLVPKEG